MIENLFNELDMDNIVTVFELIRAMTAWEYANKYYDGRIQVIRLNNFQGEIYIAHNMFDELSIVDNWQYLRDIIEVLTEYADTEERKEYRDDFWNDRIPQIIESQNL